MLTGFLYLYFSVLIATVMLHDHITSNLIINFPGITYLQLHYGKGIILHAEFFWTKNGFTMMA